MHFFLRTVLTKTMLGIQLHILVHYATTNTVQREVDMTPGNDDNTKSTLFISNKTTYGKNRTYANIHWLVQLVHMYTMTTYEELTYRVIIHTEI
jgi:hypothetical protein